MAWGTPTNIGTVENGVGNTAAVTVPAGGVPAGALIVVEVGEGSGTVGGSITDTAGNTYTRVGGQLNSITNGFIAYFYAYNVLALVSTNTITYTKQASGNRVAVTAFYVTGERTTSDPYDSAVAAGASGASTAPSVTSGTPGVAGELLIAGSMHMGSSGGTITPDATWSSPPPTTIENTGGGTTGNPEVMGSYRVEAGTTPRTWTGTITSKSWAASVIGFKAVAAATTAAVGLTPRRIFNPLMGPSHGLTPTQAYPRLPYLFSIPAEPGAYTTSGVSQILNIALHLAAALGTYALTGVAATLTAAIHGISLVAAAGAYALTGVGTIAVKTKLLTVAAGSYALAGVAVTALYTRATAVGAYTLAGKASTQAIARATAVGAYVLAGVASTKAVKLVVSAGAYVYHGFAATLATSTGALYTLTAAAGAYALAGKTTVLSWVTAVANSLETKRKTKATLVKARQTAPALTLGRAVKATLLKLGGVRRLDD